MASIALTNIIEYGAHSRVLRLVCRDWHHTVQEFDHLIISGAKRLHTNVHSMHELMAYLIANNHVSTVFLLVHAYSGYLPVWWDSLANLVTSKEMALIISPRLSYHHREHVEEEFGIGPTHAERAWVINQQFKGKRRSYMGEVMELGASLLSAGRISVFKLLSQYPHHLTDISNYNLMEAMAACEGNIQQIDMVAVFYTNRYSIGLMRQIAAYDRYDLYCKYKHQMISCDTIAMDGAKNPSIMSIAHGSILEDLATETLLMCQYVENIDNTKYVSKLPRRHRTVVNTILRINNDDILVIKCLRKAMEHDWVEILDAFLTWDNVLAVIAGVGQVSSKVYAHLFHRDMHPDWICFYLTRDTCPNGHDYFDHGTISDPKFWRKFLTLTIMAGNVNVASNIIFIHRKNIDEKLRIRILSLAEEHNMNLQYIL